MATSAVGPIAMLDSAVLAGVDCQAYLTPHERAESLRFHAPVRRSEWLAARLASKFLFLTGRSGAVHASDLFRFSADAYRSVEVTRDDRINSGTPRVRGGDQCRDVAISHSGGVACALLGDGETVAIDLERVEPRSAVFYRGNFTEGERARAEEFSRHLGLDPHWTLTLFWSIKECLLKIPAYSDLSVWDMPSIDLRVVSGGEDLVLVHSAPAFLSDFVFLSVEAVSRKGTDLRCVAVSGSHDRVIAVIRGGDRRTI